MDMWSTSFYVSLKESLIAAISLSRILLGGGDTFPFPRLGSVLVTPLITLCMVEETPTVAPASEDPRRRGVEDRLFWASHGVCSQWKYLQHSNLSL